MADGTDARADGLVAWYPMEALIAGNTIADMSGNSHDGTCTSCPMIVSGRVSNASNFISGGRIDVPATGGLRMMSGFTVAMWVDLDPNLNGYACAVNKAVGSNNADSWQMCVVVGSRTVFFGTSANSLYSVGAIPANQWRHVAITWDGTTKHIWIDGNQDGTASEPAISFDDRPVTIGADIDNPNTMVSANVFPGLIDEVRIYDHALTQSEIQALAM